MIYLQADRGGGQDVSHYREGATQRTESPQLEQLYADFAAESLIALWTQIADLLPAQLTPGAVAHVWRRETLCPLAARAGDLVPVGRGSEQRAIALANPGLGGLPYATPRLRPLPVLQDTVSSPIAAAYRWEYTDRALREQLLLQAEDQPATVGLGHAAVRYSNPTTGGDASTETIRVVGSSVWQVFEGRSTVVLNGIARLVGKGDLVAVPSWTSWSLRAETELDVFRFRDAPIVERLHSNRAYAEAADQRPIRQPGKEARQ